MSDSLIAVLLFIGSVGMGLVWLMLGEGRVSARRTELLEAGDWGGLFARFGFVVEAPDGQGRGARAVGLDGRLVVELPCASIADVDREMTMRFRLDLSGRVDPGLYFEGSFRDYDFEKRTYRGAAVAPHVRRGTLAELLEVKGDPVAVLCLSATQFAWHVFEFHTGVGMRMVALRSQGFVYEPGAATFFLEDDGAQTLERVIALLRSLDEMMTRRRGEADELLAVLGGGTRALHLRIDAACMLQERHAASPLMPQVDETLAALFTERPRGDALRRVLASGWVPSPEATRQFAARGDRASRGVLMGFIKARPEPAAYATALLTLREAEIPGAAELCEALDLRVTHGGLTLAEDDSARGALSQAGERGALSDLEE